MEQTPIGLPLAWHEDGTPIFERGDIIRQARPLLPEETDLAVIYDELMLPEHKHLRSELRFNLIVLQASRTKMANVAWLGKSYPDDKRGYQYPRVLQALDSSCRVLMQRWEDNGKVSDFVMLAMQPLQLALIPPNYEVILANSAEKSAVRFVELQAREEKRNTDALKQLGGAGYRLKTAGGFEPNPSYDELPIPRVQPGLSSFRFLRRRPLYEMLTSYPKGFDFIDPPRPEFFAGAL